MVRDLRQSGSAAIVASIRLNVRCGNATISDGPDLFRFEAVAAQRLRSGSHG
jgi:hypothetical protein